jgi:dihydrofolate reductase
MTNYIYVATSLDGFIATSDGGVSWLGEIPKSEKIESEFADFMSGIDAIVMGRKTFETVLSFDSWPYTKPVYVLSRKGVNVPKELKSEVEVVDADPKELIKLLAERRLHNLYIDGGVTIQGFLQENLIDEMTITRVPVLLGDGIPLFGVLSERQFFRHVKTEVINDMLVKSHYRRD